MPSLFSSKRTPVPALIASLILCGAVEGCSGGGGGVEIADPSKTPAPQAGGIPEGYKSKEVIID